jgi:hypothetical protein
MRVREGVAEDFDCTCGHPKLDANSLGEGNLKRRHFQLFRRALAPVRNQNLLDQSLPIVLRSGERAIREPAGKDRNRISRANRIRNDSKVCGRDQQPVATDPGAGAEHRHTR